jgi:branched-chain amino acid aminotransferase
MGLVCFNGQFYHSGLPLFNGGNSSFRYGDGLFETMKIRNGKILFPEFHFDRLFLGMKMLGIQPKEDFDRETLSQKILDLCSQNSCPSAARVRLAIFRENENKAGYLAEASPLQPSAFLWDQEGLTIDIFPYARKSTDAFSSLKTANFLPYVMASAYAKEHGLDDALVLNSEGHICDSSKANIFLLSENSILTPALHQGCVNGVIRRYLVEELKAAGFAVHQETVTPDHLLEAKEIILTNSIMDIRPVSRFREKEYPSALAKQFYDRFFSTIYQADCLS